MNKVTTLRYVEINSDADMVRLFGELDCDEVPGVHVFDDMYREQVETRALSQAEEIARENAAIEEWAADFGIEEYDDFV